MAKNSLPPGFRFHPTDVELVKYYLKRKVLGRTIKFEAIAEVDIYKYAPWDLPDKSYLKSGDLKWYFFCPRARKYANGGRMNRATDFGYWKTTGKDRPVHYYNNEVVGMIKTLVFHKGKAPRGGRTDWVMHEYRLEEKGLADRGVAQDAYVLSVVFQKEGPGPRNGAQYGAPFKEEDWDSDVDTNCIEGISSAVLPTPVDQTKALASCSHALEGQCIGASESCLSDAIPSALKDHMPIPVQNDNTEEVPVNNNSNNEVTQDLGDDDILLLLADFTEDSSLVSRENGQHERPDTSHAGNVEAPNGIDIFNDLGDLGNLDASGGGEYELSNDYWSGHNMNQSFFHDASYLELRDLDAPLSHPAEASEIEVTQSGGLYTDHKIYNSRLLDQPSNPSLHQNCVLLPDEPYRAEDQLVDCLKENCGGENANGMLLDHDDAALLSQFTPGTYGSQNPGGGEGSKITKWDSNMTWCLALSA